MKTMRRRANLEPNINHERWLVSYADFVTLLFAFFVVMYSISQVSEKKYRELSDTLDAAFTPSSQLPGQIPKETVIPPFPSLVDMIDLRENIMNSLSSVISQGHLTITGNESWTEITLDDALIFDSGKAEISDKAKQIFLELANTLSSYNNAIAIAGHTDNLPIHNLHFSNNWALSSARAVSVVRLLSSQGIKPQRLSAIGYGEFHPIASNETLIGRNKNRRVVLRVSNTAPQVVDRTTNVATMDSDVGDTLSSDTVDKSLRPSHEQQESLHQNNVVAPVILEDGSLLFTSDPDLPRVNNPIVNPSPN